MGVSFWGSGRVGFGWVGLTIEQLELILQSGVKGSRAHPNQVEVVKKDDGSVGRV